MATGNSWNIFLNYRINLHKLEIPEYVLIGWNINKLLVE